mmetsp:Transcript_17467/g.24662  ORF Transcript_17467/g.24662 Transcript_17467/m.24662 type:complete len:150 (+) Transcript_17467:98-547(+)
MLSGLGSKNIPPYIAKELQRHVKPSAGNKVIGNSEKIKAAAAKQFRKEQNDGGNMKTLFGCVSFVAATASLPFLCMQWIGPLNEKDAALTHAQIRRGAFNNSGSRDVGKDPMWDFKTGTRIKDKSYVELFNKDNPNEIDHGDKYKSFRS